MCYPTFGTLTPRTVFLRKTQITAIMWSIHIFFLSNPHLLINLQNSTYIVYKVRVSYNSFYLISMISSHKGPFF